MRLVVMSDTHSRHRMVKDVPAGDVVIHCGDALGHGTLPELVDFAEWYGSLPHPHKLLIAGNHDWIFERNPAGARKIVEAKGVTLLHDESTVIDGVRFYGSPYTPVFYDWAFMCDRGPEIAAKWAMIPDKTDVLITHGPPYGHGDLAPGRGGPPRMVGCVDLLKRLEYLDNLKVHAFGHIHEGSGITASDHFRQTCFVNAAICNGRYEPINPPRVVELG